jgi:predicted RNA-binding protein with PUA domain
MTLEIIVKGAILGLIYFFVCRHVHWLGYKRGFTEGAGYVLEQLKEMSKTHE